MDTRTHWPLDWASEGSLWTQHIFETSPWFLTSLTIFCLASLFALNLSASHRDDIPIVNRPFALEPQIFSRIRWAFNSVKILDYAHKQYHGQPYRLARGDVDVLVLPAHLIPELNKYNETYLNSHKYQNHSITGRLNELEIVLKSNFHMKMLLQQGTLAISPLTKSFIERAQSSIRTRFPADQTTWEVMQPLPKIAECISQLMALLLLGTPVCDDPRLMELTPRLTRKAFSVALTMRLVPSWLERSIVWLLPPKWNLGRTWTELDDIVVPELKLREQQKDQGSNPNVASWMMQEAKKDLDADPKTITRLIGSAFAGGIWSTSTMIFGVINDLLTRPEILEEIRTEIRLTHSRVGGQWDFAAYNSLAKLDSAMKETSRLAPGSRLVYGRVVEKDFCLSNGLLLKKGQHIATPLHTHVSDTAMVPDPDAYDPLRWYRADPEAHSKQPFTSLNEIGRWGSGRRACPGRFMANITAKIMLVELIDGYEWEHIEGQRPTVSHLHEFVFIHPASKIRVRGRKDRCEIRYN